MQVNGGNIVANILISYISKLNQKITPQKYTSYLNGDNDPAEIDGRQTNEAGTKALIEYLGRKNSTLDKMICICTSEVLSEEIVFDPDKNKEFLPAEPEKAVSFDYFKKKIKEYFDKEYGKSIDDSFFVVVKADSKLDSFRTLLPEVLRNIDSGDRIYIDTTGGFRDAVIYLQLIMNILKKSGFTIEMMIYSPIGVEKNTVRTMKETDEYYEILDGVNEFVTSGKSGILKAFVKKHIDADSHKSIHNLVSRMGEFANSLQLCDVSSLSDVIGRINSAVNEIENIDEPDPVEAIFKSILPVIKNKFIENTSNYCDVIKWCLDNGLIQQALTIYIEKIPEMLLDESKKLILAEKPFKDAREKAKKDVRKQNLSSVVFYDVLMDCASEDIIIKEFEKEFKPVKEFIVEHDTKFVSGARDKIKFSVSDVDSVKVGEAIKECVDFYNDGLGKRYDMHIQMQKKKPGNRIRKLLMDLAQTKSGWTKFINSLSCNNDNIIRKMLGLKETKSQTFEKKIETYENIDQKHLKKAGFECDRLDELRPVMLDYVLAKAFRNQINHASENENLNEKQKVYFQNKGYESEVSVESIKDLLNKAIKHVNDFMG